MANPNPNASHALPEEHLNVHPLFTAGAAPKVADPRGQYRVTVKGEEWPRELRRIELRALRSAASGQIDRLLQLANLLLQPEATDRPAAELASHAEQIRQAATALDDTLHAILDPLTETEPEPDEDED
jgi:hypothetical protein